MHRLSIITLLFTTILLMACSSDQHRADISDIPPQVTCLYLSDSLHAADTSALSLAHQKVYQNFGNFWRDYSEDILRLGAARNPETLLNWKDFAEDPLISELERAIQEVHGPQLDSYCKALDEAFRRYRYFFPNDSLPEVVFMNSGFNYGVWPTETHLGIGLDFFIGADHPLVEPLDPTIFPAYTKEKMRAELLVPDALRGWLLVHFQNRCYSDETLVESVLYYGKMMYLLELMLPEEAPYRLMDYTPEQLEWVRENERNIWVSFSDQEILYERRKFEMNRWVHDAPFTRAADLPQDTPARVGMWIGWQMVKDYMQRNPEVTPDEMLSIQDPLTFLNAYRPD